MKAPKPEAAPKGWIATGVCFYCREPIEALHVYTPPDRPGDLNARAVRHVVDKVPYRECAAARKSQTSK